MRNKTKEPKAPKEKKIKEPRAPKEKKVKEPKPPKEKKINEPRKAAGRGSVKKQKLSGRALRKKEQEYQALIPPEPVYGSRTPAGYVPPENRSFPSPADNHEVLDDGVIMESLDDIGPDDQTGGSDSGVQWEPVETFHEISEGDFSEIPEEKDDPLYPKMSVEPEPVVMPEPVSEVNTPDVHTMRPQPGQNENTSGKQPVQAQALRSVPAVAAKPKQQGELQKETVARLRAEKYRSMRNQYNQPAGYPGQLYSGQPYPGQPYPGANMYQQPYMQGPVYPPAPYMPMPGYQQPYMQGTAYPPQPPYQQGAQRQSGENDSKSGVNVYGILSIVFGAIALLCFGMWAAFFPIAVAMVLAYFGLIDPKKKKWTAIVGACLAAAAMLLCAINLLLRAGPTGTVLSADKGYESPFYSLNGYYDDEDDWYSEEDDDDDWYYDDDEDEEDWDYEDEEAYDDSDLTAMLPDSYDTGSSVSDSSDNSSSAVPKTRPDKSSSSSKKSSSSSSNTDPGSTGTTTTTDSSNVTYYGDSSQSDSSGDTSSTSSSSAPSTGYKAIFDEYSTALTNMGNTFLTKFAEAVTRSQSDDSVDLGEIYYDYETQLSDKFDEGSDKLFDYMDQNDGDYDEYEEYYDKLYDIYDAIDTRLIDAYNES